MHGHICSVLPVCRAQAHLTLLPTSVRRGSCVSHSLVCCVRCDANQSAPYQTALTAAEGRIAQLETTLQMYRCLTGIDMTLTTAAASSAPSFTVTAQKAVSKDDTTATASAGVTTTFLLGPCSEGEPDELEYTPINGFETLPAFLQVLTRSGDSGAAHVCCWELPYCGVAGLDVWARQSAQSGTTTRNTFLGCALFVSTTSASVICRRMATAGHLVTVTLLSLDWCRLCVPPSGAHCVCKGSGASVPVEDHRGAARRRR